MVDMASKCKVGAWNSRRRVWVKWLGCTPSRTSMNARLRKYTAPSHVVSRAIPKGSRWLKKR